MRPKCAPPHEMCARPPKCAPSHQQTCADHQHVPTNPEYARRPTETTCKVPKQARPKNCYDAQTTHAEKCANPYHTNATLGPTAHQTPAQTIHENAHQVPHQRNASTNRASAAPATISCSRASNSAPHPHRHCPAIPYQSFPQSVLQVALAAAGRVCCAPPLSTGTQRRTARWPTLRQASLALLTTSSVDPAAAAPAQCAAPALQLPINTMGDICFKKTHFLLYQHPRFQDRACTHAS